MSTLLLLLAVIGLMTVRPLTGKALGYFISAGIGAFIIPFYQVKHIALRLGGVFVAFVLLGFVVFYDWESWSYISIFVVLMVLIIGSLALLIQHRKRLQDRP